MTESKETLHQIGDSISNHSQKEMMGNYPSKAIARAHCTLTDSKGATHIQNYWLTNGDTYQRGRNLRDITGAIAGHEVGYSIALKDDGMPVS